MQVDVALQRAVCAVLLGSPAVALQVLGLAEGCTPPSEGTLAQAAAYVQVRVIGGMITSDRAVCRHICVSQHSACLGAAPQSLRGHAHACCAQRSALNP